MYLFKTFFKRISTDFGHKELLPLKLLFFVHSSTLYVLYPYLTIHMRELGINVEETAIMSAVTPVVAILMPPLAGLVADRIGNFKILLSLFSALGGAASLLLLLVPVGRVTVAYPSLSNLHLSCSQGNFSLNLLDKDPCLRHSNATLELPLTIKSCGFTSSLPEELMSSEIELGQRVSNEKLFLPSEDNNCVKVGDLKINVSYSGKEVKNLEILNISQYLTNLTCEVEGKGETTLIHGNTTYNLNDSNPSLIVSVERAKLCSNPNYQKTFDIRLTFWLYLTIRVFIGMIGGTAFAMFEGAVIAILREHKADYGLQRIYATIGGMISSPLSGWMIDYASSNKTYTDFRPAFYLYAALKIVSAALMLTINLEFKAPAKNVVSDVLSVLKKVEIIGLLITCFILGTAWGYIESFLFWLLQDLGGSSSLMGITITVGGIAGLPLLVMSGPIIDKIGHANVLFIGFVFYAIRLIGYSVIYNPWHCLIFEAMESVTSSLAITAAVTYAAKLSTTTTDSSIQGLIGGLYFGVGKGSGSLIGGYLMKYVGTRPTYQIFAGVTLITGCLYFIFNNFYVARRHKEEKKEEGVEKPQVWSVGNPEKGDEIKMNGEKYTKTSESLPMKTNTKEKSNGYQATSIRKVQPQSTAAVNEGFVPDDGR